MNKKEISEIKKQFTPDNCAITHICGCYVDGDKNKKTEITDAFLSLPEEERFKYFEIFRKTLSGTLGKNLLNMDFPTDSEMPGGGQHFLLKLRTSHLKEPDLLEAFYDKVIETYDYGENYLILLIHALYDIPGKSSDNLDLFDASEEVYDFILCSICPVKLSKAGLSYDTAENCFRNRTRDWLVEMPDRGFLFPAFHDRSTDIHSFLYYSKNGEDLHESFVESLSGCLIPMTAGDQKETFHTLIEETLGETCDYALVKNIHEQLTAMIEEKKDDPEPLSLDKHQVRTLLETSGADAEKMEAFDYNFDETAGEKASLLVSNVANTRKFEIKTPVITIQVDPDCADLVETKIIDGRRCLVIGIDDNVTVNGISVAATEKNDSV
ncbi:MAG: DUF4317 domain-containing protein [Lachnospiraceae bacterium]|jgi:hypothetical protein|nr:DUF4317 domain-containing protein [Lachnospiraceae bacterium]